MKGKNFILSMGIFFIIFTLILFYALYLGGWFNIFLEGGFKGLYGDRSL